MKPSITFFHWLPRILCIAAILFVSLFATDAFNANLPIWQQVGDFLIHLIPSAVLTAILLIAWKWERIGGILFAIIGLGLSALVFLHNYQMNHSISKSLGIILLITFPFFLVGILFLLSDHLKRKQVQNTS